MDLQSKLFLSSFGQEYRLDLYEQHNLEKLDLNKLPNIKEFSELRIILESDDTDYFEIPELDDYDIADRIEFRDKTGFKYLANKPFVLCNLGNGDVVQKVALIPGVYTIMCTIADKKFFSYFHIVPKDLSIPDWQSMKSELNNTISGLAVDFYKRRSLNDVDSELITSNNISIKKISLFLEKESEIRFVLEKLRKEARYKIGKNYSWESNGAKNLSDATTIRMMSARPDKKGMIFSAKRYLEYDVPENRWLKLFLKTFVSFTNNAVMQLKSMERMVLEEYEKEANFDGHRDKSSVYFQNSRLKTKINLLKSDVERLTRLGAYFVEVLKDDFISVDIGSVNKNMPKALVLNANYNFLYKLFVSLKVEQNTTQLDHSYDYVWKSTEKLYEIWTFVKSIQALIQLGYNPDDGWIFSANPFEITLPELLDDEMISFSNDDGKTIRLTFNSKLLNKGQSNNVQPLLTENRHNKPDIRLDMFDSVGAYAGSVLMDAKYKRLAKLVDSRWNKKLMDQLNAYRRYPYVTRKYWSIHEVMRSQLLPVQAVIVLYAKDDDSKVANKVIDQNILMTELNPHQGMTEFVNLLEKQIKDRYAIFEVNKI